MATTVGVAVVEATAVVVEVAATETTGATETTAAVATAVVEVAGEVAGVATRVAATEFGSAQYLTFPSILTYIHTCARLVAHRDCVPASWGR